MKKSDLIVVEKNSFFYKIKNFFSNLKNIFRRTQYADITEIGEETGKIAQKRLSSDFKKNIKEDINEEVEFFKQNNIEEFLEKARKDKKILDNLSTDRLIKLRDYLKKEVDKKTDKLCKLIRTANSM